MSLVEFFIFHMAKCLEINSNLIHTPHTREIYYCFHTLDTIFRWIMCEKSGIDSILYTNFILSIKYKGSSSFQINRSIERMPIPWYFFLHFHAFWTNCVKEKIEFNFIYPHRTCSQYKSPVLKRIDFFEKWKLLRMYGSWPSHIQCEMMENQKDFHTLALPRLRSALNCNIFLFSSV